MSRLLLYRPRRLAFKPYIASALEYIKIFTRRFEGLRRGNEEMLKTSLKCGRYDIYEKLVSSFGHIDKGLDYFGSVYCIGLYLPLEKYPDYLIEQIKNHRSNKECIIRGALFTYLDTVYFIHKILGYDMNNIHKHTYAVFMERWKNMLTNGFYSDDEYII